jgi:hypothetical protein
MEARTSVRVDFLALFLSTEILPFPGLDVAEDVIATWRFKKP